jgi:hypothetical protein
LIPRSAPDLRKLYDSKTEEQMGLEKLYSQRQRVQDTLEEKLSAIGIESGNVEVQWNSIK